MKGFSVMLALVILMTICSLTVVMRPAIVTSLDDVSLADALAPSRQLTAVADPAGEAQGQSKERTRSPDASGPREASAPAQSGGSPADETRIGFPTPIDAVLLYEDPPGGGEWRALPTRDELASGRPEPVTFANGTQHEIHGKLFERIVGPENMTYLSDVGIPNMTFNITFDGERVPLTDGRTGDATTRIAPFGEHGNGTFQFILDVNKPAGEYELQLDFQGFPTTFPYIYPPLLYKAVVYVNHPTIVEMDASPAVQVVGQAIQFSGALTDDSGMPVPSAPLQLWFDDKLLGPASDGVYLDDVKVQGAGFQDDFEVEDMGGWSTYSAPGQGVGDQWEHGSPGTGHGPGWAHSGSRLWGTVLDGNYSRGAWSFLVTPRLNFTGNRAYTLSFWAWWSVFWNEDYAYVLASMDGGATWDEAGAIRFMGTNLASGDWTRLEYNVTRYVGSDDVRFAFVFYSVDKTLDVGSDGTFHFSFTLPLNTTADFHKSKAVYQGNLLSREGSRVRQVTVKRISCFEFDADVSHKVGYRNCPLFLTARLVDNTGAVLNTYIQGTSYPYEVAIYWNWDGVRRIDDWHREPVGPLSTMDKESGNVSALYTVAWNQTLGPCSVTFRYGGSDFYTNASGIDIYFVMAKTYIRLPSVKFNGGYRDKILIIGGELRVVPDQSVVDHQSGDPINNEFVQIFLGTERIGNRRTSPNGNFSIDYLVPIQQPIGSLSARFHYMGSALFDPADAYINYSIVKQTRISMMGATVHKGTWFWLNGSVMDEEGQPVAGVPVFIAWKSKPDIGRVTTRSDGTFALEYFVEVEAKVGNVTVFARFEGAGPYGPCENDVIFTLKADTILDRRDRVMTVVRGELAEFEGKLFEDWGGVRGIEVQRVKIALIIDGNVIEKKYTAFDGTVDFTAAIDPKVFYYGRYSIAMDFEGTEFYDCSSCESTLLVRDFSQISFEKLYVDDVAFDPYIEHVCRGQVISGRILLHDLGLRPIVNGSVDLFYKSEGLRARKVFLTSGLTDETGHFEFNWTCYIMTEGNKTLIAEYEGLTMQSPLMVAVQIVRPSSCYYPFTYISYDMGTPGLVVISGDRIIESGTTLRIHVAPRDASGWDLGRLNITLRSAPKGMEITPDGSIMWKTTDGHVGTYSIQVRLHDGNRSDFTSFKVQVTERGPGGDWGNADILSALAVVAVVTIIIYTYRNRKRRHRPRVQSVI